MTNPNQTSLPADADAYRHVTAPEDRVSLREKIGLGFGRAVVDGTHGTLNVLLYPIYGLQLHVNPAALSTVTFIQRLWDAMVDPFVGQYSDNFRSRWGRRIPLILLGVFPLAFFFTLLYWIPGGVSPNYVVGHLLIVSLAFYAAHSLFSMPLGGLVLEATDDFHERTKIAGITLAFGFAVQVGSQWLFPLIESSWFPSETSGLRWTAVGCGILFVIMGLIPVLLCKERLYKKVAVKQPRVGFWKALVAVKGNRNFLILLAARLIFSFGFNIVQQMGNLLYICLVFSGDKKAASVNFAINGSCYHVAALIASLFCFPFIERLIGKRRTMQVGACAVLLGCVFKMTVYHAGWIWLPLLITSTNGIANAGVSMMGIAMLGDIADEDEYQNGLRREGLFNALLSWFDKAGNSLGSLLTGFILVYVGFVYPKDPAGLIVESDRTLWLMRFWYVLLPGTGAIITLIMIQFYRLTQKRMYEIKDELGRRRAAVAAQPTE